MWGLPALIIREGDSLLYLLIFPVVTYFYLMSLNKQFSYIGPFSLNHINVDNFGIFEVRQEDWCLEFTCTCVFSDVPEILSFSLQTIIPLQPEVFAS